MLLQETYFIAMATFAACGGSSYAYSIHNVNATNCRRLRLRRNSALFQGATKCRRLRLRRSSV